MTPEIKQKIEDKYSDIKCSDTNYRLKAAAEFGYSLASSEIEELKAEVETLKAWKESAISVTPDMQAIAKALNLKPGQLIHDKILPGILGMQIEMERLKEIIKDMYKGARIKDASQWSKDRDRKSENIDFTINSTVDGEHWQDYHTVEVAYPIVKPFDYIGIANDFWERYKPTIIKEQKTPDNMFKLGAQAVLIHYEKQINNVACPIHKDQESEDELWEDFFTMADDLNITELKQHFSITRK